MRVLLEIVHPADVLFFKRPLEVLLARGDEVQIMSRHKDVACELLDSFGFGHSPVSRAGSGLLKLAGELLVRDVRILQAAWRFKPHAMVGFGGVAISHVGRLTGIPSISFYDSENATLQTKITRPFISQYYVPESYSGPTPEGRTTRLRGTKELSYFHPSTFTPDRKKALVAGLDPEQNNYFLRVVEWRANHDIGKSGWTEELLQSVLKRLVATGKVHLSSERDLPDSLERYRYRGEKRLVHHLVAHCDLFAGESATMATEAAIMGVPAIYAGRDFPGYVCELEREGLIQNIRDVTETKLNAAIDVSLGETKNVFRAKRDAFVASCPDWAQEVVASLDRHAKGR
mgnify:CR=1 FL=1